MWFFFVGILVPFLTLPYLFPGPSGQKSKILPFVDKKGLQPGPVLLLAVTFAAVFLRFYLLENLSTWPRLDEGTFGFEGMMLAQKWDWSLFKGWQAMPPFYFWGLSLFFRLFGVSLMSLWLFPALISFLTVIVAYMAARVYFSRTFSLILVFAAAQSFWHSYCGRFSEEPILLVLGQCLAVLNLVIFLKASPGWRKGLACGCLGACAGLGFYVWVAFAPVLLLLLVAVVLHVRWTLPKDARRGYFGIFAGVFLLVLAPLLVSAFSQDFGGYYSKFVPWGGNFDLQGQLWVGFSYLAEIFWGNLTGGDYAPLWGGYLNPVESSCFFLGLMECYRFRRNNLAQWLGLALLAGLAPGILSNTLESFRTVPFLPMAWLVVAWGFYRMVWNCPPQRAAFLGILLFICSLSLNSWHLFVKYPEAWGAPNSNWTVNIKSTEYWKAYSILKGYSLREGPGAALEELQPDPFDRTLTLADYAFDTARNPAFRFEDSRWIAVITNVHYYPFLQKRFPYSAFYPLLAGESAQYGGDILEVIPISPKNLQELKPWFEANQALQKVTSIMMERKEHRFRTKIFEYLYPLEPLMKGDPFLESCFWEKVHVQNDLESAYGDKKLSDIYQASLYSIQQALRYGYPTAHFYNELGILQEMGGRFGEARVSFQKAVQAPLDRTSASLHLEKMRRELELEKHPR